MGRVGRGKERKEKREEWVTKTRNHTERQMSREGIGMGHPKKNSINCHAVKCSFVWWRKKGQKRKQDRWEERKEEVTGVRGDQQGTRLCFSWTTRQQKTTTCNCNKSSTVAYTVHRGVHVKCQDSSKVHSKLIHMHN